MSDLKVLIIRRDTMYMVTDEKAIKEFQLSNWENFNVGDPVYCDELNMTGAGNCLRFRSYKEGDHVIFNYNPILCDDYNTMLSKSTCVGIN